MLGCLLSNANAAVVEPEKEAIYSNTIGGLMCGTGSWNQCQVPAGKRLIIEHVSVYAFLPSSPKTTISASLVIKDAQLGLNGNSFHSSVATKTYSTGTTDVFAFLHTLEDDATSSGDLIFLKRVAVAVSGYLVSSQ
jgi:hypothetical protein